MGVLAAIASSIPLERYRRSDLEATTVKELRQFIKDDPILNQKGLSSRLKRKSDVVTYILEQQNSHNVDPLPQETSLSKHHPGVPANHDPYLETSKREQDEDEKEDELVEILKQYVVGNKLVTLQSDVLARQSVLAEFFAAGTSQLCWITGLLLPSSSAAPPRLEVVPISHEDDDSIETVVMDLGQITTIWPSSSIHDVERLKQLVQDAKKAIREDFPVNHGENVMQTLYNSHVGRDRDAGGLTKKSIAKLAQESSSINGPRIEEVLRKLIKAGGPSMSRLVDSSTAMEYLYDGFLSSSNKEEDMKRRLVGAEMLSMDAALGGRFKRLSCIFVTNQIKSGSVKQMSSDDDNSDIIQLTVLNGGWLVVDNSVRVGAEARKFAERAGTKNIGDTIHVLGNETVRGDVSNGVQLLTAADERIAHRLECLAMGESLPTRDEELELDVREALKSLELPISPEGAKSALLKLGRWSEGSEDGQSLSVIQPWSKETMDTARSLRDFETWRRSYLYKELIERKSARGRKEKGRSDVSEEGRIDLTPLPCVCIDAPRATFRDDAIGVRRRSTTGRKVIEAASKWEILIHIADVSDVFSPLPQRLDEHHLSSPVQPDPKPLLDAAASRGLSRYDLPLGPLHLMPPIALEALSLVTQNARSDPQHTNSRVVNRCVTMWLYIDERSGKLIDKGYERTLISSPVAFTFDDASTLMESTKTDNQALSQAKAIMSVAERNLSLWSRQHNQTNVAAQKREQRMVVKEMLARETNASPRGRSHRNTRNNESFLRTRGHRMVDSALDVYAYALSGLMYRKNAPVPRASGSGADRGGRLGTAPLRRYIDGIVQRQALSVLCGYGGPPMTMDECRDANRLVAEVTDALSNIRSFKPTNKSNSGRSHNQREDLQNLAQHLARMGNNGRNAPRVAAISTGRQNEVVILGVGSKAICKGVSGTLKPGEKVMVEVSRLDPKKGLLDIRLST
mmetsp:Transcript_20167/g.36604  ORF Transcript_20167/g.36604 Transcript_20167/m.36604 type:complete len:967 (-) Transcript_20167:1895-4795(-)